MNRRTLVLIIAIMLLGSILRVYNIGSESFWIDEGSSAMTVKKYNGSEILKNVYLYGQILPGYYPGISDLPVYHFTLYYWTRAFGISEAALRLYSALFGILSMPFVFLIARSLYQKNNAILSSFLFAISIPMIAYSQEARPYALYLFLGLASTYYFINSLKSNKKHYSWLYILFSVLGLYTHFLFEILLLFQIFYLIFYLIVIKGYSIGAIINKLLKDRNSLIRKFFYIYLIIALISAPLIPRTFREGNAEYWRTKPTLEIAAKVLVNFATWIYPSDELRVKLKEMLFFEMDISEILLILSTALTAVLSYLLIARLICSRIRKYKLKNFIAKDEGTIFLLGWFAFPIIFSLIASILTPMPILGPIHYLLYSVPAFIMLLSEGMLSFRRYFAFLLVFFIIINILPLYSYYANVDKQQWRELAHYLKGKVKGDEVVIFSLSSGEVTFRYYYGDAENIHGVKDLKEAVDAVKGKEALWLILSFWRYQDPSGSIQDYINENYELIGSKDFFDIKAYHFQKKKA